MSDLSREQTAADNLVLALREALAKVAEAFSAMMRAAE